MYRTLLAVGALLTAAACMTSPDESGTASPEAIGARAALVSADGAPKGTARLSERSGGLEVHAELQGLPPGAHGIHIHTTGRCDAPDFASAGPHWNPTGRQHGRDNPQGAHHGDLPNVTAGADGRGTLHFTVPEASLASLFDADGAALVVHAAGDDYRTDPSGNSGGRIACGVISRP